MEQVINGVLVRALAIVRPGRGLSLKNFKRQAWQVLNVCPSQLEEEEGGKG